MDDAGLLSRVFIGYAIDFDFGIDDHAGYNAGASWRIFSEELFENRIEGGEVPWIVKPHAAADNVFRPIARLVENRQKIANRLARLGNNIPRDQLAIEHRSLA
jgi:hypothetical protein